MKRDLVGGEWKMRVRDRGEWRQYQCQPHPDYREKEESNNNN